MSRLFVTLAIAFALLTPVYSPVTEAANRVPADQPVKAATAKKSTKWLHAPNETVPDKGEPHRYIVEFEDEPLPLYRGGISGLPAANVGGKRMNPKSAAARAYVDHLRQEQSDMLSDMRARAGDIQVLRMHQHALNAVTVLMTEAAANKVRALPGVRLVERDRAVEMKTASTPAFIGADQLWNGSATGVPYQGEGEVIGVIDGGINHHHPSFAATGADGYTVLNPLGSGNYLGECNSYPGLCNDKLIGAYTFLDAQPSTPPDEILLPGDAPSRDTNGHGSHTASTAAGDVLYNVPLPDADGNPSSVVFPRVSGVAPHANIVVFKVCAPSCYFSDIVAAVDQAIADGVVDVINHSIGTPSGSPWDSTQAQAFLAARAAGIFVSNSAGNDGPDAGTAEAAGNAPWVAGVAATTHDRSYPTKLLKDLSGGGTPPPADITGRSLSGSITGNIVYAADFPTSNGSENDTEPEQCLAPFPPGTFTPDQIVLCDRGTIARVAKGQNVRDGGAGGLILGNIDGGSTTIDDDPHVIPAIHVGAADADVLRAWLASGSGHTGTITAVDNYIIDPAAGDIVASFSSRGPYTGFDILAPSTAAPGVNVFAAGAELTQGQIDLIHSLYDPDLWEAVPNAYGVISGTSMASPHIAGTAALLKQAHPGWTDAEVLSAIMTTGKYELVKEDGVTPADSNDIGGGRVQVAAAVNAGLVLDETAANFQAANPDTDGDPASLNVAGLVQDRCILTCTWTRTVTATVDGSWTAAGFDPWVTVSPATFSLAAGETQELEVSADAADLPAGGWSFSRAVLTPATAGVPPTQMPIAVVPATGELPASVNIGATRDAGSQLVTDVTATTVSGVNVKVYEPAKVEGMEFALPGDSDNGSPFDDLTDGVTTILHDVPAGTQRAVFQVLDSQAPDLDLYVGVVLDPSNPVDSSLLVCVSATGTALESCDLDADFLDLLRTILGTDDLTFFAVIQNWAPSAPDAVDQFHFAATNVSGMEAGNLHAEGPPGSIEPLEPFDVRFFWNLPSQTGDEYLSATEWYGDAARTELLGKVPLQFDRGPDDVTITTDAAGPVDVGQAVAITANVQPNFTPEDRTYNVYVPIPWGMKVDPASISEGGSFHGHSVKWTVTQDSLLGDDGSYVVSTDADNPYCDTGFGGFIHLADYGILPDPGFTGDTIAGTFFSGQNPIQFYGAARSGGLTVTDDGFGFFSSSPGPNPWVNQLIPDPTEPNDVLAPLWSDWFINYDDGSGGRVRGISAATAGPDVSILEWDGVEFYPGDGTYPITADFEIVMYSTVDPVYPEIVFAYDNVDEDFTDLLQSIGYLTTGVENRTGTAATDFQGAITDGLMVCFDYQGPNTAPRQLSFSATARPILAGQDVTVFEVDKVDNPGARPESSSAEIEIDQLPYKFQGFFGLHDGKKIHIRHASQVLVAFKLLDPLAWWHIVYDADATIEVTDADGNVVSSGDARFTWFGLRYVYTWRLDHHLKPGNYTITAHLDDGTSHSVTVTLVK
jgi:subtilisin family serine protease